MKKSAKLVLLTLVGVLIASAQIRTAAIAADTPAVDSYGGIETADESSVVSLTYNNSNASTAADDPVLVKDDCNFGQLYRTMWYSYTSYTTGYLTLDTYNSPDANMDTVLAVHSGNQGESTIRACNDNGGLNNLSRIVAMPVIENVTYHIEVAVKSPGDTGTFGIEITPGDIGNSPAFPAINPYPADGAKNVSLTPTLTWDSFDADEDALTYYVGFGANTIEAIRPLRTCDHISQKSCIVGPLEPGTTYYWSVTPIAGVNGGSSNFVWSFTTAGVGDQPPNKPDIIYPTQQADYVSRTPTLLWSDSDPDGTTLHYTVYFGEDEYTWSPICVNTTLTSCKPAGTLAANQGYTWRVVATDGTYSTYSDIYHFGTYSGGNIPPSPPWYPWPAQGDEHVALNHQLMWVDTDQNGDTLTYSVELGANSTANMEPITCASATQLTCDPGPLLPNTTYYWSVDVDDGHGGQAGSLWNFTTGSNPLQPPGGTPAAPSALAVASTNETSVSLQWADNATNETGYVMYQSPDGVTGWLPVGYLLRNQTTSTVLMVTCGTQYYYRVRADGTPDSSGYSNIVSATTSPCAAPHAAPYSLIAAPAGPTSITVAWLFDMPLPASFRIERSADGSTGWAEAGSMEAGSMGLSPRSFTDTGLTCNTTYFYRVRARNAAGDSAYSNTTSSASTACAAAPAAPTSLSASPASPSSITLSWQDNASNETSFRIERSPDGSTGWVEISPAAANATSQANGNLACNTTYYYQVRARNTSGDSGYSNVASATTGSCPALPDAPSSLNLALYNSGLTKISISWEDNSSNETSFRIEQSPDGSTGWAEITATPANSGNFIDTGTVCGATYFYRVRARNAAGDSAYTGVESLATSACPAAPAAPTSLSAATASPSSITLSWVDNSSNETSFRIERSADGVTGWVEAASSVANATSLTEGGLTCNTTYYYQIRARNAIGDSGYSNVASATTGACPPAAPSLLTASGASTTSINLGWQDNSTDETSFRVERSANGFTGWAEVGSTATNVAVLTDTGLTCNTTYYYRVRARGASDSAPTNVASAATNACPPPNAPSLLTAAPASTTSTTLGWQDNSDNETSFRVERSANGSTGWAEVGSTAANVITFTHNSLSCGTTYYYRVRARNSVGNSAYTSVASTATNACPPPNAPTLLTASASGTTSITLGWQDNSTDETSFRVERSPDGSTGWTQITSIPANSTSYASISLTCNATYYYRVRAHKTNADSDYTNVANATTNACPVPNAPTLLTASAASATSITLGWQDNSDNETSFRVERSPDGSTGWAEVGSASASTTIFSNSSLTCNTTYYYRVRARNNDADSAYTDVANATTNSCPPPTAPSQVTTSAATATGLTVSWQDNSANETSFRVERSTSISTGWAEIASTDADVTSLVDSGLMCNTVYYYRVRARNASGNSAYSPTASGGTSVCPPPAAPSSPAATANGPNNILITWQDNATNEANFRVERSTTGISGWDAFAWPNPNATSATDSNLACNTTYYYRVRAENLYGNSAYTSVVSATTDCNPAAPSGLSATPASASSITLSWLDNASNETQFQVERSADGSGGWAQTGTASANSVSFTDTGLACETTYFYRVRAHNGDGNSAYSNTASATTSACPPDKTLKAPKLTEPKSNLVTNETQPVFTWGAVTGATRYRIQIASDAQFTMTEQDATTASPTFTADALADGIHYWRVAAQSATGIGKWAAKRKLTIDTDAPDAPVLKTPLNLAVVPNTAPKLVVTKPAGAYRYVFQVSEMADFSTLLINAINSGPSFAVKKTSGILSGHTYYWRVAVFDIAGNESDWSLTGTFSVQ